MRLTDLEPQWLERDGVRVGLLFRNPVRGSRGWWTSCFFTPTPSADQDELSTAALGEDALYQGCNPACGWKATPAPSEATFDILTITPSLDGGPGWWHGFITNGEIVGGI